MAMLVHDCCKVLVMIIFPLLSGGFVFLSPTAALREFQELGLDMVKVTLGWLLVERRLVGFIPQAPLCLGVGYEQ